VDGNPRPTGGGDGVAFLLSQLGALAATRFGERMAALGLTAAEAGVLRLLGREEGLSQRALAARLGAAPSRVVLLVDALEAKGLVRRAVSPADRRAHELHLTTAGRDVLAEIRTLATAHESEMVEPLEEDDRPQLAQLLRRLADGHHLAQDVHPGYRARG